MVGAFSRRPNPILRYAERLQYDVPERFLKHRERKLTSFKTLKSELSNLIGLSDRVGWNLGVVSRDGVRPWRDSESILRYLAPTKSPRSSPHYHHSVGI